MRRLTWGKIRFYARKRAIEDLLLIVLVVAAGLLVFFFLTGLADKLLEWASKGFGYALSGLLRVS